MLLSTASQERVDPIQRDPTQAETELQSLHEKITVNQSIIYQSVILEWLSSNATGRTAMGVTVKKCHMIMSGNDCWNKECFSCCRKADDVTVSGSLFQNSSGVTEHARPPTVDSLNGRIRKRFSPAERSASRPDTLATWSNELR